MNIRFFLAALAAAAGPVITSGEIVYDNSSGFLDYSHDSQLEYGDEIELGGSARWLTDFSFEFFASFTSTGDESARLRIYANDGPVGANSSETPGSLLYDSGSFEITSGYWTMTAAGLGFLVPDAFTWTVEFSGLTEEERAGLLLYDPPAVGSSPNTFWENENGVWSQVSFPGLPGNFAARAEAEGVMAISGITMAAGTARIESSATPGRFYTLEYAEEIGGEWKRAASPRRQADSPWITLEDPAAGSSAMRFYRIRESFAEIALDNGEMVITAAASPGQVYRLESTADFQTWVDVPGETTAEGNTVSIRVPAEGGMRFFRVVPEG